VDIPERWQATPWNRPGDDTLGIAQMNVSLRPFEDRNLDTISRA
jgi:hypothetical protein